MSTLIDWHLQTTMHLASWRWQTGIMAFKMRPKHHYLYHISCDVASSRLNPRMYHCWEEEKFLGALKRIAIKCHGKTMQKRCLQRWVIGVAHFLRNAS